MKTNEAPEKIYLEPLENDKIYNHWYSNKLTKEFIEYTRTDAFIEKACEWLKCNFNMPDDFESHFKEAMEE